MMNKKNKKFMNEKFLWMAWSFVFLCSVSSFSFAMKPLSKKNLNKNMKGVLTTQEKSKSSLPTFNESLFEKSQSQKIDPKLLRPSSSSYRIRSDNQDYNTYGAILDKQINELKKLVQKAKSKNGRSDLVLRLAELYVEKANLVKTIIEQKYDQNLARLRQSNPQQAPPPIDYKLAQGHNKVAIQLYEGFLKEFPQEPRADQALFFLGYNYFELGDVKKGLAFYQRLPKEFPKSDYIVESRFALGEYYFENDQYKEALEHYRFVSKSRNKKLVVFSQYKVAWTLFKMADYKAAMIALEKLIKSAKSSQKNQAELKLDGEARRDLVLFYSEAGGADKAPRYFNDLLGSKESFHYLEKLAYVYADKGDRDSARILFQYLIVEKPLHSKSFDYQYQIVRLYSTAKNVDLFKSEIWKWIKNYGPKSQWFEQNRSNKELADRATLLLEQTLRVWILQQHQTAQNSRGDFSQKMALSGYQLYFSEFSSSPHLVELRFFHGELLYDMEKFDEASREYRFVVDKGGESKYRNQAAANILVSVEKSLPSDEVITKKVGETLSPVALGSSIENYILQAQWYVKNFPSDKKVAETQFRIGRLYYQHNHFEKAIPYFRTVVKDHSQTKFAEYSANLLLDIYGMKKDYEGLSQVSQELLAIPAIANSSAGKEIREVVEKAGFKKAQDLEAKSQYKQSAEEYEKFVQTNPNGDLTSLAYFNAAINYNKAGYPGKSVELLENLHTRKDPKAMELKSQSMAFLPHLYRDTGQLERAAGAYVASAQGARDPKEQADQVYNAAILYEALDHKAKALGSYLKYYELSKNRDKVSVLFSVAQLYRRNNQRTKALEFYQKYLNESSSVSESSVESAYWLSLLSQGSSEKEKWAATTIRLHSQLPEKEKVEASSYPSKIELEKLKGLYSALWAIKLNNVAKLQELMNRKIGILESINKKAAVIVKYNAPEETLEAVKIVGDSNLNLYESLVNSPVPPELTSPEKIQEYRATVKTQLADPFLVKASEAYELVVQKSSEFETYLDFSTQARKQLFKLKPQSLYETGQTALEQYNADWMGL
jgi:cellulose synthase operon protein C